MRALTTYCTINEKYEKLRYAILNLQGELEGLAALVSSMAAHHHDLSYLKKLNDFNEYLQQHILGVTALHKEIDHTCALLRQPLRKAHAMKDLINYHRLQARLETMENSTTAIKNAFCQLPQPRPLPNRDVLKPVSLHSGLGKIAAAMVGFPSWLK